MEVYLIDDKESLQDAISVLGSKPKVINADTIETTTSEYRFIVSERYKWLVARYENPFETQKLIYGKNPTPHITAMSFKNDSIWIYRELPDGSITEWEIPFENYVIFNFHIKGCTTLKGNTHFKYLKCYNEDDYQKKKKNFYKYKGFTYGHQVEAFQVLNGYTYFKGMKPKDIRCLSFDIETSSLNPDHPNAEVLLITNTYRHGENLQRKTFDRHDYVNDGDMIDDWCNFVREINPSLIIGHNITMFDLTYLDSRSHSGLKLGRDGSNMVTETRTRELRKDGSQSYSYNRKVIFGREVIDTFFLAIKYDIGRKYSSYALKSIIKEEGKEKQGRTFVDASKMLEYFYDKDSTMWNLAVKYGEEDSDDALTLFDIMISSLFYMTQMIPKPFQIMNESATGAQLNALMVRGYLQDGYSIAQADDRTAYEGAISLGVPGIYKNVIKLDVASLYPSIMIEYKIENKEKDFNGNFQYIVHYLRKERLKNKQLAKETGERYYDDLQNAQKTVINSLYGFLGASGLNFNYPEGASEVTRKGREILSKAILWATGNEVTVYQNKEENVVNEDK